MALLIAVPFTSFAEEDEDYCFDETVFVWMTPEEVSAEMLKLGMGLDKLDNISLYSGSLVKKEVVVTAERAEGRVSVFFSTEASMVANEIGIKNLKFYENGVLLKTDLKIYTGFKQKYSNGYYYTAPVSGGQYYAAGSNFALFTNTEIARSTASDTITY